MGKHLVSVDRTIPLAERPSEGHNRWHPDITPMIHVQNGDEAETLIERADMAMYAVKREKKNDFRFYS